MRRFFSHPFPIISSSQFVETSFSFLLRVQAIILTLPLITMNRPMLLMPLLAIATLYPPSRAYVTMKPPVFIGNRRRTQQLQRKSTVVVESTTALRSSIGGGGNERPKPPEGGGDNSQWDDFFRQESENLQRAREYMSENALPLNYDPNNPDSTSTNQTKAENKSSSLVRGSEFFQGEPNAEVLASNPYLQVVSRLSPSELIAKFTSSAHPRVQNAVRSTILSLIGGLPKMMFDVTTVTTGQRLASLMFQLQVSPFNTATFFLFRQKSHQNALHVDMKR